MLPILALTILATIPTPQVFFLWPERAPGSEGRTGEEKIRVYEPTGDRIVSNVHKPSVTVYLPEQDKATGAAVVIVPGGGHREIWIDHEGHNVAKWLVDHGIAGVILTYRLAKEPGSTYQVERESFADVQRAIRFTRTKAQEWHIDPDRLGVMGFSAGGEIAMLAGTRYTEPDPQNPDPIERNSSKPNFEALIYPATPQEHRITRSAPPTFLLGGEQDPISNDLPKLYQEFKDAGVPVELHMLSGVGHGFGVRPNDPRHISIWLDEFLAWLQSRKLIN